MKNEKGITLIELLAVLVIIGLLTTLIASILINGMKASDRSTINQRLQQEASYITETIRNEYLKREPEKIKLIIDNTHQTLKMDGNIISEGYTYCFSSSCENEQEFEIDKNDSRDFKLELKKTDLSYEVVTTYSKLR